MATATYGKLDNRASSALARLPVRRVAADELGGSQPVTKVMTQEAYVSMTVLIGRVVVIGSAWR